MPAHDANTGHDLDFGVQVKRAATGKIESPVPEAALEPFGFGLDPTQAVENLRAYRERQRIESGRLDDFSWNDTEIYVVSDEEDGYPTKAFSITLDIVIETTREPKAMRQAAQILLDYANGLEPDKEAVIGGAGIRIRQVRRKEKKSR